MIHCFGVASHGYTMTQHVVAIALAFHFHYEAPEVGRWQIEVHISPDMQGSATGQNYTMYMYAQVQCTHICTCRHYMHFNTQGSSCHLHCAVHFIAFTCSDGEAV